jgi:hypothetical protein
VQIFLSYRRGDVGGYAGRLTDALRQRLGAKSVFQDVTAIAPGQDYTAAIDRARLAARCGVVWARTRRCSSARSSSVMLRSGRVGTRRLLMQGR